MLKRSSLSTGDLIFVRPHFDASPVDRAILDVGAATIRWLRAHGAQVHGNETSVHVALAWRNESAGGLLSFVEAVPPAVRLTRAEDFWRGWPAATFYRAQLKDPAVRWAGPAAARMALSKLGTPYSDAFAPPPKEFYCSSLVEWAYQQAVRAPHVFVDEPFPLIFVPRPFWVRYYASLNLTLPPANTTGSNPTLLLHSPHVAYARLPGDGSQATGAPRLAASGDDLLKLTVELDGAELFPPGSLAFLHDGAWHSGGDLRAAGAPTLLPGTDALGKFVRRAQVFSLGGARLELSVRAYATGALLVFEQSFPDGYNATATANDNATANDGNHGDGGAADSRAALNDSASTPGAVVGLAPLASWPSFALAGASRHYAWRSWHGTYGSFTGVGLRPNDTLVFNGVPTMPVLFFGPTKNGSAAPQYPGVDASAAITQPTPHAAAAAAAASVLISPLDAFKAHAHAAAWDGPATRRRDPLPSMPPPLRSSSWRHGPSSRFEALPPGFSMSTVLVAARGQTAAVEAWGDAMRRWHGTDRREALAADVAVNKLGYWTDNGAYYNFNKWAGNLAPGREWSPRRQPSRSPDVLLSSTIRTLRSQGVRPAYMQLDDWYYDGVVYEGAVSCVRDWRGRRDWFPAGLADFSKRNDLPLLLYLPYLCNDTALRHQYPLDTEAPKQTKRGGVPDPPYPSSRGCAWPQNKSCAGRYALPSPTASERFYRNLFELGAAEGMASFEHDFTGQDSLDFGWTTRLGAGSEWLQGMGRAAAARRVPTQLCLVTASDLFESLTMPWVTNARASGDYAFCADGWDIGFSSMLHWAVGVRPFKDVMWTTPHQPGSPYQNTTLFPSMYKRCLDAAGRHAQPNVQLDALVSAFSTGPVGLGDGDGLTNAALALATCRADGVLLQPAKPLTPLDATWWPSNAASAEWLLGSYSSVGGTGALWQYIVAVDVPCATTQPLHPAADLYWPAGAMLPERFAVWRWGTECTNGERAYTPGSCISLVDTSAPGGSGGELIACTTPGTKFANGTHAWSLTTLAPLLPGPGWTLLGEPEKFVGVSSRRFSHVNGSDATALLFVITGMPSERLQLLAASPPPDARVMRLEAVLPAAGTALCQLNLLRNGWEGSLVCS